MYLFYFHFVRVGRPAGRREMSLFSINSISSLGTFLGGQHILSISHIAEVGLKDIRYRVCSLMCLPEKWYLH